MRFACYDDWSRLPASTSVLFEETEKASLFFSRPWFETLHATAFADGPPLLLACVVEEGCVLALLPLIGRNNGHWQSLSHRYTPLFSLMLVEVDQPAILACLVEGLSQLPVRSLQLEPVAEDDSKMLSLQKAMISSGFECHRHFRSYNWVHRTRGLSFEGYMADRPARLRNIVTRKRRKLEREHDAEIRMFTRDEVRRALADYHTAYSASWKANEQYGDFLDTLAIKLSIPNWTRLAVLYIGGKPTAAQLWFVLNGKASIFRLAYDDDWRPYSPGTVLTAYLMRYVIDIDRVEEIDFLVGNEPYKQDWMSERRERYALLFVKKHEIQKGAGTLRATLKNVFKE